MMSGSGHCGSRNTANRQPCRNIAGSCPIAGHQQPDRAPIAPVHAAPPTASSAGYGAPTDSPAIGTIGTCGWCGNTVNVVRIVDLKAAGISVPADASEHDGDVLCRYCDEYDGYAVIDSPVA